MLLIAWLMVSDIYYPSFKKIDWNTQTKWGTFLFSMALVSVVALMRDFALAILFASVGANQTIAGFALMISAVKEAKGMIVGCWKEYATIW